MSCLMTLAVLLGLSFVATCKYALLLSLADLAVERGDDTTEELSLDTP